MTHSIYKCLRFNNIFSSVSLFPLNIFRTIYFIDKTQLLDDGKHVYPFEFSLPHHLPSTFNEYNGHVRYTVKVTIVIPWGINEKSKTIFKVFSPINLNSEPILVVSGCNTNYSIFCV